MPQAQQTAVVAVVLDGPRTLVVRRSTGLPSAGYWSPVVGHVRPGESEAEALTREVLERVGLRIKPRQRIWESSSADGAHTMAWWLADSIDGEALPLATEIEELRWVLPAEFDGLDKTYPTDRYFYSAVFRGLPESGFDAPPE